MEHADAIRLQAAVKYVLGELPEPLRDEYEEHYFDCAACAIDVKALATFMDGARETLRQMEREESRARVAAPVRPGLFAWFRPAFALPAFAALLLMLGYQNFVSIPRMMKQSSLGAMAEADNLHSLLRANSRGGEGATVQMQPGDRLSLTDIAIPPSSNSNGYIARLLDASGNTLFQWKISDSQARRSEGVSVTVPRGTIRHIGSYTLVVLDDPVANGQVVPQNEVLRSPFTVAFVP